MHKRNLTILLLAPLLKIAMSTVASGDVIWQGTGTVTNSNPLIQANVGDTVAWSIEYEEASLNDDFDDQSLSLSIQFSFSNSQSIRLDSPNRKIDRSGHRLVNWSLSQLDTLSYTDFPATSTRTIMTMRLTSDDLVDGYTYLDLRYPFFGYVDTGVGSALWFEVDIPSIEIFERTNEGPLEISVLGPREIGLTWPIVTNGHYRVEASADLKTFFNVYDGFHSQPTGTFTEQDLSDPVRFYRLLSLSRIFPND